MFKKRLVGRGYASGHATFRAWNVLALVQVLQVTTPGSAIGTMLPALPNLAAIVWLAGVFAFQSPRFGRMGTLGLGAAMVGVLAITIFNLLRRIAETGSEEWASTLIQNPAIPLVYTVTAVLFIWGVLALGTSSLQTGKLPQGAVVFWMIGFTTALTSSWLPASLLTLAGVLWSSIILLRSVPVKNASLLPEATPAVHATDVTASETGRFIPLDALRGIIMILMAIDHASYFIRRWHPFETWDGRITHLMHRLITLQLPT